MLQGQNCSLIRNHFVKQEWTYEKDAFYASFLFEHLSFLTNSILQTGTYNLSWQPELWKKSVSASLPSHIGKQSMEKIYISKGFIAKLLPFSCLLDHLY